MDIYPSLTARIREIRENQVISPERMQVLQPLADYIKWRIERDAPVRLNFICTHNSRRSHLAQVWAQAAAAYYDIPGVFCYSGGTEETALFPMIAETLSDQGFLIVALSAGTNPVYAVKFGENAPPVIGFSKKYDHVFNPVSDFAAVLTCDHADENCPFIPGADKRISLAYDDPKVSDGTDYQKALYSERSRQIAAEMLYVFSKI